MIARNKMDWTWAITLASIIGTVANIKQKAWCFYIWIITNLVWAAIDYRAGIYAQVLLMLVYFLLSVWGIIEWSRHKSR